MDASVNRAAPAPQNLHSTLYDMALCTSKRLVRDYVLFPLDKKLPIPESWKSGAQALGQKISAYSNAARPYENVFNIHLELTPIKSGTQAILETAKHNFSDINIVKGTTPLSLLDKTVFRDNMYTIASPLSDGLVCQAATRIGFMALATEGAVAKTIQQYQKSHSILQASKTAIKEGTKSLVSWESGNVGAILAEALIPIEEYNPAIRIAGMVLGSVGAKRILDKII